MTLTKLILTMMIISCSGALAVAQPATEAPAPPQNAVAIPATQPATIPTVLILPINMPAGNDAWIANAIRQDMVADLTAMVGVRVLAPASSTAALDEAAALDQGRQANVTYVVYGYAHISGGQLRVTGSVLDVAQGKPVASIKSTAAINNLFPLEDALAMQVARAVPRPLAGGNAWQSNSPNASTPSPYVSEPYTSNQPPAIPATPVQPYYDSPSYYNYTPSYDYSPYAYSYPYDYYYPYSGYLDYGPYWGGLGFYYGGGYGYHHGYWHGGYRGGAGGFRGGASGFRGGSGGFHGGGGGHR